MPDSVEIQQPAKKPWTRRQLFVRASVLARVAAALRDRAPMSWGEAERIGNTGSLKAMGLTLVSETAAKRKHKHVLLRGVTPVAYGYFGAPLQRTAALYLLDVQTRPAADDVEAPARAHSS